jgi:hypothetical protein
LIGERERDGGWRLLQLNHPPRELCRPHMVGGKRRGERNGRFGYTGEGALAFNAPWQSGLITRRATPHSRGFHDEYTTP